MCREIEKLAESRYAEGEAKGRAGTVLQFMRNTSKTFDEIAVLLGYTEEQTNELRPIVEQLAKVQN